MKKLTNNKNSNQFGESSNKNNEQFDNFNKQTPVSSVNASPNVADSASLSENSGGVNEKLVNPPFTNSKVNLVDADGLPVGFVRKSNRKLKPTKAKRRYLTCPDGVRRWLRIEPPGVLLRRPR